MTTILKKFALVVPFDKTSPRKNSLVFLKNSSSSIVTEVPTVDNDCGFLLGAITIIGISFDTRILLNKKDKRLILLKISLALAIP